MVGIAATGLPRLELRTDGRALVPRADPAVRFDAELRRDFGLRDPLLVYLETADEGGLYYCLRGINAENSESSGAVGTPEIQMVLAPIAPGVIPAVPITSWRRLAAGERVAVEKRHCTVALDGEREVELLPGQDVYATLSMDGPWVVDVPKAMTLIATR